MGSRLVVGICGQSASNTRPFHPAMWLRRVSGPEWLVRRVDKCVEIGERFCMILFTLYLQRCIQRKVKCHSSIDDARAHTLHHSTRPLVTSSPTCLSACVWQAQPACLYLQFLPDVYIALTVARRTGQPSDKSTVTLTERKNPWRRADRS